MPNPTAPLEIHLLEDSLEPIEREWTELWERCPEASPFQHPRWLMPWWRHFGPGKALQTLAVRDHADLIAIAPLCLIPDGLRRKLMPLGISLSDHLDALIAPGYELSAAEAILSSIATLEWDVCELQPLPATSPLLSAPTPAVLESITEPVEILTSLNLPVQPGGSPPCLSRHFAKRIAAAKNHAAALGPVRYETATDASFEHIMDFLLHFHDARWRGCSNESADPSHAFHREAALAMLERGVLHLRSITISGRIAAALYAFVHQGRGYFYIMAFDPAFSRVSPGVLLITRTIEEFHERGIVRCEFLRGQEAFKYRWNITESTTYARKLQRKP